MKKILLIIVLMLIAAHPASAQVGFDGDARVESVAFSASPMVNQTSSVTAIVNVSRPATVDVSFKYGDGTDLNPLDPARSGSGSSVTRVLSAAGSHPVTLSFTPPFARKGEVDIVVLVTMEADTNRSNDRFVQRTFIRHAALGVAFDPVETNLVAPEGTGFATFTVQNLGNVEDTPVALAGPVANGTHWNVTVLQAPRAVAPGAVARGSVLIRSLADNDSVNVSAWVMVSSSLLPGVQASAESTPFSVNNSTFREARELVASLPADVQLFPGETWTTNLTLENRGARGDVFNVSLRLGNDSVGWNATFGDGLSRDPLSRNVLVPIARAATVRIPIVVQRGTSAPDTMALTVNATALDEQVLGSYWPDQPYRRSVGATLKAAHAALTVSPIASAVAYEGDQVTFRVRVANEGRMPANDTLLVEVRDNLRVIASWTTPIVNLSPGAFVETPYLVNTTGFTGRSIVSASLGAPPASPASVTSRTASLTVRAPVLSITTPDALRVAPGSRLVLMSESEGIAISNGGESAERVMVQLRSEDAAWLDQEWVMDVPSRARVPVAIDVSVPQTLSGTRFDVVVTAWIESRPSFNATSSFELVAFDDEAPSITWQPPADAVAVGAEAVLRARITDSLGVRRAEALITAPSGQTLLVDLVATPGTSDFLAAFIPSEVGEHQVELRATDAAEPANVRVVDGIHLRVAASPYAGVRPATIAAGGSTNADLVRFVEVEPGTTRSVEIDTGDGYAHVGYPYQVALTGPDGPRVVRTRATSLQGVPLEATWNFTLDRVAPVLSAPTVAPSADGLAITVVAEGAASLSGWIETPSGQRSLEFRAARAPTFAAIVPGVGTWSAVTVVAVDAAGNEASVRATSGEGRAVPALQAFGLLLGISIVALRLRRPR